MQTVYNVPTNHSQQSMFAFRIQVGPTHIQQTPGIHPTDTW